MKRMIVAATADGYVDIDAIREKLGSMRPRSAWDKGVIAYAEMLLDDAEESVDYEGNEGIPTDPSERLDLFLNGASDWNQYSWGGSSLVYDGDIAKLLCNPTELKRTKDGELPPNQEEEWLDVQARALEQAYRKIVECMSYLR